MPQLRTLMNMVLGYGARAEDRSGPKYRTPSATLSYGDHPLQALDLHLLPGDRPRPLLAFIHGGAWQFGDKTRRVKDAKVPFAHSEGYHFAALNFRLVPEVGVHAMAQDVAAAFALLFEEGSAHGIDRRQLIVMGHSSGAHLAALIATNPELLGTHGLTREAIAAVIAIDGAAFDPQLPSTSSPILRRLLLDPAFGKADRQKRLSPVHHAKVHPGRIPHMLILHGSARALVQQAEQLQLAIGGKACVERHQLPGRGILNHMRLSRNIGRAGYPTTEITRKWLCNPPQWLAT